MTPPRRLRGPLPLYIRYCIAFVSAQLVLLLTGTMVWERWVDDVHDQLAHDQSMRYEVEGTHALIAERLLRRQPEERADEMKALQAVFAYPIHLRSLDQVESLIPASERPVLMKGGIVMTLHGSYSHQRLGSSDQAVTLGRFDNAPAELADLGGSELLYLAGLLSTVVGAIALPLYFLIHRLWHDVRALHDTVHHLRANAFDHPIPVLRTHLLRPLGRALQDMAQQMRTLLDGQRLMGQAMAHELRTPITRLRFTASLVEEAAATADSSARGLLQEMQADLQWLEDLTSAGVEYVRFGRMPLVERTWVDLRLLLRTTAANFMHQQDPRLRLACVPGTGVHANAMALELAVRNLLANAVRHAHAEVMVTAEMRRDGLHLRVEDDGPGIPPARRQDVFAPYVRLSDTTGGFGLGLAMVRTIAERHGGRIDIQDSALGGACLALFLPHHDRR
ncbi:sensor histidine kinase [Stenotrophomonas rhizophila]|uniref:sensor histidine kinase n=1 Tax=Stenotrophomonas rhizophila TaxID=216778 RepID=UPI0028B10E05|nr:ATP-binding protein [Stenotrophomonas rhizophila]